MTWLLSFLSAWLGQAAAWLTLAGGLYVVTRHAGRALLAHRQIRLRVRSIDHAQLRHELGHTSVVLAIGTAQAMVVTTLAERGLAHIPAAIPAGGLLTALCSFVVLILFNDAWFYSVHRLLHTPWLYRHVHAVHHRSAEVSPLSSYSFHVVEAALLTGWIVPAVLLFPLPLPVLMAAQVAGLANNLMAHLGFELLPAWWTRAPALRWSNSATFHALHHARYRGNYGLFTRLWDRLFGTELTGYEEAFAAAHGGAGSTAGEAAGSSAPAGGAETA